MVVVVVVVGIVVVVVVVVIAAAAVAAVTAPRSMQKAKMCASGKTAECCGFVFTVVICNGFMSGCFLSFEIRRYTGLRPLFGYLTFDNRPYIYTYTRRS